MTAQGLFGANYHPPHKQPPCYTQALSAATSRLTATLVRGVSRVLGGEVESVRIHSHEPLGELQGEELQLRIYFEVRRRGLAPPETLANGRAPPIVTLQCYASG